MYCQICGARNQPEDNFCSRCHQKLLVVSGRYTEEDQEAFERNPEEQLSFDEHLLERISILEEVVKRTAVTVRQLLGTLYKLEQKTLVNQTGVGALRDLLEHKRVIGREEWSELWESRLDYQLLALEKRERYLSVKNRIAALYRGVALDHFQRRLDEAEEALLGFDIEGAVQALEEAYGLDDTNHELAFFLGETYFNEGRSDAALRCFETVLTEQPEHYEALVYSGVLQHEQGEAVRAETLLTQAAALYPQAFLPAFSLGAVYASQDRLQEAMRHLEKAVAIDPEPQALYLLGSCCYERGRVAVAIRHLKRAVEAEPSFAEARYLLGLAYLDRRWHRKALATFREAQRRRPESLQYRELAQLVAGPGETPWPTVEDRAGAWLAEADQALARQQRRKALSYYRRALANEPENPALLVAYAMHCLDLDRLQEVQAVIEKAIGLEPGEPLKATAYTTLIEALRTEGKLQEGNRIGRLLLAEGRSDFAKTLAYCELAYNLAELEEDLDDALTFARCSLELSPESLKPLPLAALGWVHYKRRELTEAIDCLTRASQLGPSTRTFTHLGIALLASGARDEARQMLLEARSLDDRHTGFGEKVIECLKDSSRLQLGTQPRTKD